MKHGKVRIPVIIATTVAVCRWCKQQTPAYFTGSASGNQRVGRSHSSALIPTGEHVHRPRWPTPGQSGTNTQGWGSRRARTEHHSGPKSREGARAGSQQPCTQAFPLLPGAPDGALLRR